MATSLARLGTAPHVVSECLGHAPQGITRQVYDHYSYRREMQEALARWAEYLEALGRGAEVVPIKKVV
jgi:integrase